ncbi:MAG TPA: hypothetical protein H9717_11840 [Candidatus Eisenbergiella merdipullorum]|uniref:Uncharacterized protein n=1 Tax=Candidatus Eisenbergiella merdipullorum TaxID=2838553 RepID=A0A9D2I6D7_9FIRM|nr:hypothetical protein [Candidatus Eisenbergiella merdipullorum]
MITSFKIVYPFLVRADFTPAANICQQSNKSSANASAKRKRIKQKRFYSPAFRNHPWRFEKEYTDAPYCAASTRRNPTAPVLSLPDLLIFRDAGQLFFLTQKKLLSFMRE